MLSLLILIIFVLITQLYSDNVNFFLFIDDNLRNVRINGAAAPIAVNSGVRCEYHTADLTISQGDILTYTLFNDIMYSGILGKHTVNHHEFIVDDRYSDFWYVDNIYTTFPFYHEYRVLQQNLTIFAINCENIQEYNFYFIYPFLFIIDYDETFANNGYITEISLINAMVGDIIVFLSLPSKGVLYLNSSPINQKKIYSLSSLSQIVYKSANRDSISISEFYITNPLTGNSKKQYMIHIVQKEGFDCFFNMTYSISEPYCIGCRNGYYHLNNNANICVNETTKPKDYYLDNDIYRLNCDNKWYTNIYNIGVCTNSCFNPYSYLLVDTSECVSKCPSTTSKYITECYSKCSSNTTSVNSACIETTLLYEPIDSFVTSYKQMIETNSNIEENIIEHSEIGNNIKGDGYYIQVYPIDAPLYDSDNVSSINFGECETLLRKANNMSNSDKLIVAKYDIIDSTAIVNKVEYKIFNEEGKELDLSVCRGVSIEINYVLNNITGINYDTAKYLYSLGVDLYDPQDKFYNDKCFPYSENESDVVIQDRREKVFVHVSFCEEGCLYSKVNFSSNKVECNCTGISSNDKKNLMKLMMVILMLFLRQRI